MDRPRQFRLNYGHPLAQGLVFAGLGGPAGVASTLYRDSSLYCNHGTLTNMDPATDWVWDQFLGRWVLDFDGSNDGVDCGAATSFDCTDGVSVAFWMKITSKLVERNLVYKGKNYVLGESWTSQYQTDDTLVFGIEQDRCMPHTKNLVGTWHHVTGTFNNQLSAVQIKNYVDGAVYGLATRAAAIPVTTRSVCIGGGYDGSYPMLGRIGDPLIYNRALSTSEISILADPSNTMLGGLLMPPKRRYYRIGGGTTYHGYPYPILDPMHGGFQR